MLSSTSARPLMPLPPMPMKWIRCVRPYKLLSLLDGLLGGRAPGIALGPRHERAREPRRGGGGRGPTGVRRRAGPGRWVGERVRDLVREALAGESGVLDHAGGAAVGEVRGVHPLMVVR